MSRRSWSQRANPAGCNRKKGGGRSLLRTRLCAKAKPEKLYSNSGFALANRFQFPLLHLVIQLPFAEEIADAVLEFIQINVVDGRDVER